MAAEDALTDESVEIRTAGPHNLLLPKDWPVEYKDGRYAPVGIEEYLSLKFGQVRAKFEQTDQRAAALERRLAQLEQEQTMLRKGMKLLEERLNTQEATNGHKAQGR